ncbi:MAG: hypothetical protein IIX44_01655 [Clostridia bacterium]|nr:hypothetical protein [Clostridia bacterium]
MKNSKIIIIAASLVLAAALALCGCVYLIGDVTDETRGYDPDEMTLPSVIEETPSAQSELQKKFGAYGREETGERGERIFRLFTEEQIEESLTLRKNGERRMLTYEEILFLINDSIRMYFEYDKIIITDFICHTHDKVPTSALDYDMKLGNNRYRRCEVYTYEYIDLIPYHGDYSDKSSYADALATYRKMIEDIQTIIFERLRIHDTGSDSYCLLSPLNENDYPRLYGILLDGGNISDAEKYETVLNNTIKQSMTNKELVAAEDKYPLVRMTEQYEPKLSKPQISIYYISADEESKEKLYPTEQLEALHPDGKVTLSGKAADGREITFEFDRWNWRVVYTEKYMESVTVIEGRYTIPKVNSVDADFLSLSLGNERLNNERLYMVFDGDYVMIYQSNPALPKNEEKPEPIKVEVTSFYGEKVSSMELFHEK